MGRINRTGLGVVAMLATGCATYTHKTDPIISAFAAGNHAQAVIQAEKLAGTVHDPSKSLDEQARGPGNDRLLFRLEQGAVLRAAGDFEGSNLAFDHARQLVDRFDEQARVKLAQEGTALLTNPTVLDYRGRVYDRVMLWTYRAMNYLEAGQIDQARPELLAAYERQRETVERYAKQIDAEQQRAIRDAQRPDATSAASADVQRTIDDPFAQASLQSAYAGLEQLAVYEDFVNPFAEYLQGLFFLHAAADGSDVERGRVALRKAAAIVQSNDFLHQDAILADQIASGARVDPITYVIFETGIGPRREQIRIDLPIFIFNLAVSDTQVDYVGLAFPTIRPEGSFMPFLRVDTPEGSIQTQIVADMDAIVAAEFKRELPMVITKTIASTAIKAALAYGASRATEDNEWLNIAARIGATIYQAAVNQADLRTWRTLPKQFQVARFPTPADRTIRLGLPSGVLLAPIPLVDGNVNVVYVRSTSPLAPMIVRQYALR
jgi:hypothetical protein